MVSLTCFAVVAVDSFVDVVLFAFVGVNDEDERRREAQLKIALMAVSRVTCFASIFVCHLAISSSNCSLCTHCFSS